jgi:predicted O-methyltransferase YrrM
MSIFLILTNLLILLVVFVVLWKVRSVHLYLYDLKTLINNSKTLYAQIESLIGLYNELKFSKSLQKTRGWAGSPDFLLFIAKVAQSKNPMVIIECSSGVSTVVLAQCLKLNGQGHLYSLEHDSFFAEQTRMELKRHQLDEWSTVVDAPLKHYYINDQEWLWYSLDNLPKNLEVDMIVIDGPPFHIQNLARYPAGPLLFNMLNKSGSVILDDAAREEEQKILKIWKKEFPRLTEFNANCEKGCVLLIYDESKGKMHS